MKLKMLDISLSKEERRMVDAQGNIASTWARIGVTVEFGKDDTITQIVDQLRAEIQPLVDDWLLRQGGYIAPLEEEIPEIGEGMTLEQHLEGAFGPDVEVKFSEVSPNGGADPDADEIPL